MKHKSSYPIEILEGFYVRSWENSSFYQIRNKKVYKSIWTNFEEGFENTSSININNIRPNKLNKGIYLKVEGTKIGDGNYGHLGASDSLLTITKIIEIDTTVSFSDFY